MAGGSQGTPIVTPLEGNNRFLMRLVGDVLLDFAVFIDKFDGAVTKTNRRNIAGAPAEGHPIVVDCVGVEFHPLGGLAGVGIPLVDDVVVTDAEWGRKYLVSSLKEHQDTDVHMSSCLF